MSYDELIELRAAAARLYYKEGALYNDFKMLINFIEKIYEEKNDKKTNQQAET